MGISICLVKILEENSEKLEDSKRRQLVCGSAAVLSLVVDRRKRRRNNEKKTGLDKALDCSETTAGCLSLSVE